MSAHVIDDPAFLPFKLDLEGQRVLLLRLDAVQRADAAFLDQRALPPAPEGAWVPLAMLREAAARLPDTAAADFIFHIGHCGSTLLSRLLQAWPRCQVLREPLPLRTLAAALDAGGVDTPAATAMLGWLTRLWQRPLAGSTRTVIKATSSCNALVAPMLAAGEGRGVLLAQPLPAYLATLLKSRASIEDVLAAEPGRLAYLAAVIGGPLPAPAADALAARCALAWLAERVRFARLATGPGGERLLRLDFEQLLAEPAASLAQVAAHLRLRSDAVPAALASPAWQRYSKAQDHAYDAGDRAHDLALARRAFAGEIEAGIGWVDGVLAAQPTLAALAR